MMVGFGFGGAHSGKIFLPLFIRPAFIFIRAAILFLRAAVRVCIIRPAAICGVIDLFQKSRVATKQRTTFFELPICTHFNKTLPPL